jgi:predicted  nucleic acid-binding Zn-ribbon protein
MPHRCLECKSVLESKDLDLSVGCPVCGNKKFEYVRPPKKETVDADLRKLTVSQYVAYADSVEPKPEEKTKPKEAPKHHAQKPPAVAESKEKKPEKKPGHEHRIDSVRIVEKGNSDLNLPMLLNRKELVMSKEDGVYVVDLPSALKTTPKKKKR